MENTCCQREMKRAQSVEMVCVLLLVCFGSTDSDSHCVSCPASVLLVLVSRHTNRNVDLPPYSDVLEADF